MFRKCLKEKDLKNFDFSTPLFPPASDRELWDKKYDEEYIKNAENFIGYDWPLIRATDYMAFKNDGNRLKQETPHFKRREVLASLVTAEVLEHKGRFIPDIVDGIFLICEESFWGVSAHSPKDLQCTLIPDIEGDYIDLFGAETAANLAVIYYILYDQLSEYCDEILVRIKYEIERRIIKPYLNHTDFWWMGYYNNVNNWNPWILSNLLTVFLLLKDRDDTFFCGIKKMLYEINSIYDVYPMDGGCDEGASYWTSSGATFFEFCYQLYITTKGKLNFFDDEKVKNIGKYEHRAYIGNGYFMNFADGSPKPGGTVSSILYLFGKMTNDKTLMTFAKVNLLNATNSVTSKVPKKRDNKLKRILNNIIYTDDILNQGEFVPEENFCFNNTQVSFARQGKWYYASKGGHNAENHNHNDVGSFIVYYDNSPLLIDPSCGVYTKQTFSSDRYSIWTMQSDWHNTVKINGCSQNVGKEYCADYFNQSNKTTNISFSKAYPEESKIDELKRSISINDNGITLSDSFVFKNKNGSVAEHFITPLDVTIKENYVIIGDEFILKTTNSGVFSSDRVGFDGDKNLTNHWDTDGLNRIIFKTDIENQSELVFEIQKIN